MIVVLLEIEEVVDGRVELKERDDAFHEILDCCCCLHKESFLGWHVHCDWYLEHEHDALSFELGDSLLSRFVKVSNK